jgi:multidrug efflux pump subunit AcrB
MKKTAKSTGISRLSVFFYKHFILSAVVWVSIFIFGILSYVVFLQRQGFPPVNVPVSIVQGVYFVNDKTRVDAQVSKPLTQAIQTLPEVKSVQSTSFENQATLIVQYNEGVNAKDGSRLVEDKVQSVSLPQAAQLTFQPTDATRFNSKYDVLLSISAADKSVQQLEAIANDISSQLDQKLPQATLIETISPFKEAVNPVTGKLERQQSGFDWFGVRTEGNFVINQSVVIGIQTKDDEDVLGFDKALNTAIAEITKQDTYKNVSIVTAAGFASSIRDQISSLQQNLIEGLLIVVAVCLIFIGLRAGLLAAIGMLMTLSITAGILFVSGLSLNTITLFGLVLCLGLIVDDTVIMIEAIDTQRKKNKPLKEAIAIAARKVALASAAGTFTTVLGFAPLLFIGGILGDFIKILPITIIASLLTSLAVSLFFIPFVSRWLLGRGHQQSNSVLDIIRRGIHSLGEVVARFIESATTRRKKITYSLISFAISIGFIMGTGPLFAQLKFDIFPTAKDANSIQIEYTFAPGTDTLSAQQITNHANGKIVTTLGDNIEKLTYQGNANSRQATANITLKPYDMRDLTANNMVGQLRDSLQEIHGARIVVSQVSAGPPKDQFPFRVQIPADDPVAANEVAEKLAEYLKSKAVTRPNGTTASVNEVEYTGEKVSVTRVDGQRIIEVKASFDAEDTSALVQAAEQSVRDDFLSNQANTRGINTDNVRFDYGNESANQESFKSILVVLPFLVLAMFVLLAIQFRSLLQPVLILIAVPFSFFGVAVALFVTDNPLSFFVMVAFFALIGISVNNSILLTDYANQGRRAGLSPRSAMAVAVRERMRPLLTTSATSILALLPLALTDPFWESLAVTLIGGLAASTILVIVSFPYYYLALEAVRSRVRLWLKQKRSKK